MLDGFIDVLVGKKRDISILDMDDLLAKGSDLSFLPTWPLYLTLKKMPEERTALFLDKCSPAQRRHFLDMDLWSKDELDFEGFSYWIRTYAHCQVDDIKSEFVQGTAFSLYLKGRFNLMSFNEEHPVYPDHDNFFITDDNMILVEYDRGFTMASELKGLLNQLYIGLGVNKAWAYLFKIISDPFMVCREEEYQEKRERLRDIGMVDYYDALALRQVFSSRDALHYFIQNKNSSTGSIDEMAKKEWPHPSFLAPYRYKLDKMMEEFSKVEKKRQNFLYFDFVRLVNGTLALQNIFKKGSLAISREGNITRNRISLGFWYAKRIFSTGQCLFDRFIFTDFYKIGLSLVIEGEKQIKNALRNTPFAQSNAFLGDEITRRLAESYDDYLKANPCKEESMPDAFQIWMNKNQTVVNIIPYAVKFHQIFDQIVKKQQVQDAFYVNYRIKDIDFEALLVSNFINFTLGHKGEKSKRKLAVTIDEFKKFYLLFFDGEGHLKFKENLEEKIEEFTLYYGLHEIFMFVEYFTNVLNAQLAGYRPEELKKEEFCYVGGPLIFDRSFFKSPVRSSSGA